MAAAARPAPRGLARRLHCGPGSNRLSRLDVSAPPPRPRVPPPPRAGLRPLPPLPAAPGSRTLRPGSVVIVTSQRDGPGWNLLLLRDVKSRAGGSSAAGLRGRRERWCEGGGYRPGGGGGCDRPRPSAAKRRAALQVSAGSRWEPVVPWRTPLTLLWFRFGGGQQAEDASCLRKRFRFLCFQVC
uniref:Uncharacterized protein n=1 Tax=Rangifer tarandus platyrhynchus TaxID=3082113 RepID=A0ACB0EUL1_RANTA|nr:unnamed protein product [Rangifer tarandus platyrhynchus]